MLSSYSNDYSYSSSSNIYDSNDSNILNSSSSYSNSNTTNTSSNVNSSSSYSNLSTANTSNNINSSSSYSSSNTTNTSSNVNSSSSYSSSNTTNTSSNVNSSSSYSNSSTANNSNNVNNYSSYSNSSISNTSSNVNNLNSYNNSSTTNTSSNLINISSSKEINDAIQSALAQINQERVNNNLSPLELNNGINMLAQKRAEQIVTNFSHYDDQGPIYEDMLVTQTNLPVINAVENMGYIYNPGQTLSQNVNETVHDMFYNDEASGWGHRYSFAPMSITWTDFM
ncbi:CAP domain-containing protein [Nicoliella lavandulae]|uniref:SCP domain-containing protein n=1 Tax=Nicoliella lavandulae TaxID=3082954 RepID=A0ABU8SM80_9LACO